MASLAEYEAAVAASSPEAWWKLDEASGNPQDSSGNGFDMTTENIAFFQEDGPFPGWENKAVRCTPSTGCSRANVGTAVDNITFECWYQLNSVTDNFQPVAGNHAVSQGWTILVGATSFYYVAVEGVAYTTVSPGPLAASTWYHFVITRRSGTWMYFLNGEPVLSNAGTDTPNGSPTSFVLMGGPNIDATMSQAAYYDRSLSNSEILAHYAAAAIDIGPNTATWAVGTLDVPVSTGTQAYTPGFDGRTPLAMIFYGTNWLTEDVVLTDGGGGTYGMFRGMAAPAFDDPGTLLQSAASNVPTGDGCGIGPHAILMTDPNFQTLGSETYVADVVSFDVDGFTLDWTVIASSGYKIIWIALFDVTEVASYIGTYNATPTLGFKAGASLLHGQRGGPGPAYTNSNTQSHYGGAAYNGITPSSWSAPSVTSATFPDAGGQRYVELNVFPPSTLTVYGIENIGPFLVNVTLKVFPTGAGQADLFYGGSTQNGGMVTAWNDDDSAGGFVTGGNTAGDEVFVSTPFAPGLVVGYTISNVTPGGLPISDGALGFWVATPDFQWCAIADGTDPGAFQSFNRGYASVVSNSDLNAGTVELLNDGFKLTNVDDDITVAAMAWHAFGHPTVTFLPSFFRRRP